MRVPLSGIVTGFRIRESGTQKERSEYGYLDVLQPGNKDFDSTLTYVVIQDTELIRYFLAHYSSGTLKWADLLVHQVQSGRETVWLLIKVFNMEQSNIVLDYESDGSNE